MVQGKGREPLVFKLITATDETESPHLIIEPCVHGLNTSVEIRTGAPSRLELYTRRATQNSLPVAPKGHYQSQPIAWPISG